MTVNLVSYMLAALLELGGFLLVVACAAMLLSIPCAIWAEATKRLLRPVLSLPRDHRRPPEHATSASGPPTRSPPNARSHLRSRRTSCTAHPGRAFAPANG